MTSKWIDGHKVCPGCGINKPADEYFNSKVGAGGKTSRCKVCVTQSNNDWNKKFPGKRAAASKAWRDKNAGTTYLDTNGYVRYVGNNHPACAPGGLTMHHRIILWDKLGGRDALCHWCGKQIYWNTTDRENRLTSDHLNGIRNDNRLENLVPSCQLCNSTVSRASRATPIPQCSFEGCRDESVSRKTLYCHGHYNQLWKGEELKPIKKWSDFHKDSFGRECTECGTYKAWEDYYNNSDGTKRAKCKSCCIRQVQLRKQRVA